MKKMVIAWLPVVLVAAFLFFSSSQTYQEQDLRPTLSKYVNEQKVTEKFSDVKVTYAGHEVSTAHMGGAGFVEFFIRKGAHFTIYGLLGLFVYRALLQSVRGRQFMWALAFVVLYAVSDEFHQYITGDRTPLYQDVCIDTAGGLAGIVLYMCGQAWHRRTVLLKG